MKKCVYDADSYCAAKSTSVRAVPCECEGCGQLAEASEVVPINFVRTAPTRFNDIIEGADYYARAHCELYADVIDTRDEWLIDTVIAWAKTHEVTEVYLLDRDFVRSALLHEAERMKRLGFEERERKYREISDMNSHEEEEE